MSTLRLTTISNQGGTATVPSETVINGSAKAWVNFNGTGTVAIRASFNVSSITDGGTGDYTVNFTNAFTDTNYVVATNALLYFGVRTVNTQPANGSYSTTSIRIGAVLNNDSGLFDPDVVSVTIFR